MILDFCNTPFMKLEDLPDYAKLFKRTGYDVSFAPPQLWKMLPILKFEKKSPIKDTLSSRKLLLSVYILFVSPCVCYIFS